VKKVAYILVVAVIVVTIVVVGTKRQQRTAELGPVPQLAGRPMVVEVTEDAADPMQVLLGDGSIDERIASLQKLDKNLNEDQVQKLVSLLASKDTNDTTNSLKINVLQRLRDGDGVAPDIADQLMSIIDNAEHNEEWRVYCVKQLGSMYGDLSEGDAERISQSLWQSLKDNNRKVSGAAFVALSDNINQPGFDKGKIADKALELANDSNCELNVRTRAFRTCAKLSKKDALPAIREVVKSSDNRALRIVAISSIGKLGDAEDRPALEQLAKSSDPHISMVAKSALRKL